jgi:hypothetical protein
VRITVNVADVVVEIEDDQARPTVEAIETLLARACSTALNAYSGLVEIDGLAFDDEDEDEEEIVSPDED